MVAIRLLQYPLHILQIRRNCLCVAAMSAPVSAANYRLLIDQLLLCNDEIDRLQQVEKRLNAENAALKQALAAVTAATSTPSATAAPLHKPASPKTTPRVSSVDGYSTSMSMSPRSAPMTARQASVDSASPYNLPAKGDPLEQAIKRVYMSDLTALKHVVNPPEAVKSVMEACCIIFGLPGKKHKDGDGNNVLDYWYGPCTLQKVRRLLFCTLQKFDN